MADWLYCPPRLGRSSLCHLPRYHRSVKRRYPRRPHCHGRHDNISAHQKQKTKPKQNKLRTTNSTFRGQCLDCHSAACFHAGCGGKYSWGERRAPTGFRLGLEGGGGGGGGPLRSKLLLLSLATTCRHLPRRLFTDFTWTFNPGSGCKRDFFKFYFTLFYILKFYWHKHIKPRKRESPRHKLEQWQVAGRTLTKQ